MAGGNQSATLQPSVRAGGPAGWPLVTLPTHSWVPQVRFSRACGGHSRNELSMPSLYFQTHQSNQAPLLLKGGSSVGVQRPGLPPPPGTKCKDQGRNGSLTTYCMLRALSTSPWQPFEIVPAPSLLAEEETGLER